MKPIVKVDDHVTLLANPKLEGQHCYWWKEHIGKRAHVLLIKEYDKPHLPYMIFVELVDEGEFDFGWIPFDSYKKVSHLYLVK